MALSHLTPGLVAAVFTALIGGAVLHEFTHAAAARLLGGRVRSLNLWGLEVVYELAASEPVWKDRVINLAPQIVGMTVAVAYIGLAGVPTLSIEFGIALLGWTCYTVLGGWEDYSLAAAHGETSWWDGLHPRTRQTSLAVGCLIVGEACLFVIPQIVAVAYSVERVVTGMGAALIMVSICMLALPPQERSASAGS